MTNTGKPLTGRKVLAIAVAAFAVIIGVNLILAWQAVSTFPGLEVKNSYVASQSFDERRAAQEALGWQLEADYQDGLLTLNFTGTGNVPVDISDLSVLVGRTAEARDDMQLQMTGYGGSYSAPLELDYGRWLIRISATAPDGTIFQQRRDIFVGR